MKTLVENFLARVTSGLLTLMHNKVRQNFSREEFRYLNSSFSQFGEDIAVERWVERCSPRSHVYVDVGCFHPIHCSNTLLLHKRGWRGVNVDVDAFKIEHFKKLRPNDFNIVAAVSDIEQSLIFHRYKGTGTNRLSSPDDSNVLSAIGESPIETVPVRTRTLTSILDSVPGGISEVGYLNVDCEGHDLHVLKGLDFSRYAPEIITVEALTVNEIRDITSFLSSLRYEHRETIYRTLLFVKSRVAE